MSQVRAGAAYVELTTRDSKFLKGLQSAQKRLQAFGQSTRLLGTRLMGLGTAAAAPLAASVAVFSSFDDAMRGVAAITQATGGELESLRNTAKKLGATTSFSASEVASLMTELGRAGFDPTQIERMTASVMNLARATGTDATQASGIMAATIRQFGMEAGEATRVADGLTAAANKSFNTVESLGEALSYAGPVAANANMSLEETLAILGTLGNMGIQGSSAGSAMRRLLTISAAESEKFHKVFGVTTKDAEGNARSLVDVLGEVAAATENMGTAEKAEKLNEVFGLLGITAASSIGKSVADTRELYKELQKAGGIAEKTAEEMEGGLGGAFRILKSSIEAVAIAIGESLEGSVTTMIQAFSRAASGLVEWIGKNQRVVKIAAASVVAIIGIGAALFTLGSFAAAAAFAVGGLASIFSFIGASIGVIVTMVGALFTPLGAVVAAVAALGAYFLYSTGIAGKAIEYLKGVFETLKADTLAAFGAIANALKAGDITAATDVMWSYLKLQWVKGTTYIKNLWTDFTQYIAEAWSDSAFALGDVMIAALSGLVSVWNSTLGFMADGWTILTSAVQKGWNNTIGFLKKGFLKLHELVDIAGDVAVKIGGVLVNALAGVETAWVETVDYLTDTWTVFVGQVKSMWNSTVGFLRKAWIKLKGLFDEDIDVDAEMRKIDAETSQSDRQDEQKRLEGISQREQKRKQRKAEIEANRQQMQEGIQQQLDARRKAREGQNVDADMRAIDQETDARNAVVDQSRDMQFAQNEANQSGRQQTIDNTTAGVQAVLDQMRADSQAGTPSKDDSQNDGGTAIDKAQADFDAAVERAKQVGADATGDEVGRAEQSDPAIPKAPPAPQAPKSPEISAPDLELPEDKDLRLGLDRGAKRSIDQFAAGPDLENVRSEVAGEFDARSLGLGGSASNVPPMAMLAPEDDALIERVPAPLLKLTPEEEPSLPPGELDESMVSEFPAVDIESINAAFESAARNLGRFDAAISASTSNLQSASVGYDGFSEEMKRAILQTATNTEQLVRLTRNGGLSFA
ncbi:phage tail tape measure protein [Novipirellula artificiosorum]|uniref:Phage-related minor tail protein n=1 Tax=Novipirellula artificiosorum TaxID=2528016 RepID=A0A5C6DRC8_9BACT|nr:phage tail tape measure protein [Novipirellula artificiosorum]TWU39318.1 Phage-related minor tail protein [Novipirellula artificiosorum]